MSAERDTALAEDRTPRPSASDVWRRLCHPDPLPAGRRVRQAVDTTGRIIAAEIDNEAEK